MIPLKLKAIISDSGKLCFSDTELLQCWLARYGGKTVDVTFGSHSEAKTQPQLGYLFGHVIPQIAEYTGYSEEEVYGILKGKFLMYVLPGRDIPSEWFDDTVCVRSLSDCNKEEVSKFIEQCIQFGTELGAEIWPAQNYGGTN